MKTLLSLTLATVLIGAFPALAAPKACDKPNQAVIHVNGMVCDFCARTIEKTMKEADGVTGVAVDLTAKTVTLALDPAKPAPSDAQLTALITDSGYDTVKIDHACK